MFNPTVSSLISSLELLFRCSLCLGPVEFTAVNLSYLDWCEFQVGSPTYTVCFSSFMVLLSFHGHVEMIQKFSGGRTWIFLSEWHLLCEKWLLFDLGVGKVYCFYCFSLSQEMFYFSSSIPYLHCSTEVTASTPSSSEVWKQNLNKVHNCLCYRIQRLWLQHLGVTVKFGNLLFCVQFLLMQLGSCISECKLKINFLFLSFLKLISE